MLKALYYPHTDFRGRSVILKNALLLWDNIETIVPSPDWKPLRTESKLIREAHDLVVQRRVPSDRERKESHKVISAMLNSGFLARLIAESPRNLHGGME